jgi:hypothetical protein
VTSNLSSELQERHYTLKRLVIEIDPQGNIVVDDDHGGGGDITADLEEALGEVTSRKQTCAARPKKTEQKVQQRG